MITENGPKVIEFNVRFGDPEAKVIFPRLENDLAEIFLAVTEKRLHEVKLRWQTGASVCMIAAAPGYPGPPTKGLPITLPEIHPQETQIFHAGTAIQNEQLVTNGGRVFGICAQGTDIAEAREQAYSLLEKVRFQGKHFRSDIAVKALN